jgi:hypothetical protein
VYVLVRRPQSTGSDLIAQTLTLKSRLFKALVNLGRDGATRGVRACLDSFWWLGYKAGASKIIIVRANVSNLNGFKGGPGSSERVSR